jgi:hypothetical protein
VIDSLIGHHSQGQIFWYVVFLRMYLDVSTIERVCNIMLECLRFMVSILVTNQIRSIYIFIYALEVNVMKFCISEQ